MSVPVPAGAPAAAPSVRAGRFLSTLRRALRQLGLQVSAVLYLVFALAFAAAGFEGWRRPAHGNGLSQLSPAAQSEFGLALLFLYFGFSSLARARHAAAPPTPAAPPL